MQTAQQKLKSPLYMNFREKSLVIKLKDKTVDPSKCKQHLAYSANYNEIVKKKTNIKRAKYPVYSNWGWSVRPE